MTDKPKCAHKFVRLIDRWYGQGKYSVFVCNDCGDAFMPELKPFTLDEEIKKPEIKGDKDETR